MLNWGAILFFLFGLNHGLQAVVMTKVFYHRGQCADKLVFYFDQKPNFKQESGLAPAVVLANIQIDPLVIESLPAIAALANDYQIDFRRNKQQLKINFKFKLPKQYLTQVYEFKPISQPAGLVIKIVREQFKITPCVRDIERKTLILDFGHGDHDTGAKYGSILEKNIVRAVGLILLDLLKKDGYAVFLTRKADEFVPLDERTYLANMQTSANLFISLHANHSSNAKISGIETYYMHNQLFSSLQKQDVLIPAQISLNNARLAKVVHENLLQAMQAYQVVDRKVKPAVSQVLLGVEMPAILIELGFLSNPKQAQQLNTPKYQALLAQGIYQGIKSYLNISRYDR